MQTSLLKPRISSLSGLKVIAVILVIICHLGLLPTWDMCARMVEVLFLISGFCMAYNHYQDTTPNTALYGIKLVKSKLPRFYPLHILTFLLQVLFVATWADKSLKYLLSVGLLNLSLQHAWFSTLQFSFNNVSWFLSALVFCYFITPSVRGLCQEAQSKHKLWLLFLIILGIRTYLEYMTENFPRQISIDLHTNPLIQSLNYSLGYITGISFLITKDSVSGKFGRFEFSLLETLFLALYLSFCATLRDDMYRIFFVGAAIPVIYILGYNQGLIAKVFSQFRILESITLEIFMLHSFILYKMPHRYGDIGYYLTFSAVILLSSLGYHYLYQKIRRRRSHPKTFLKAE